MTLTQKLWKLYALNQTLFGAAFGWCDLSFSRIVCILSRIPIDFVVSGGHTSPYTHSHISNINELSSKFVLITRFAFILFGPEWRLH